MRWQCLTLVIGVLLMGASPCLAQNKPGKNGPPVDEQALAMDQSLQEIFKQADRNHNNFLSKTEFKTAQALLESHVAEWGQRGMIGKPAKKGAKKKDDQSDNQQTLAVQTTGDKLAKSNKVNLSEFVGYAQSYVAGADDQFRELKAMTDAQRKAYQNQRRMMINRRRGRY